MSDDRYARVYFDRIASDPKFDGIRSDRARYGSWLMMLQEAEKAWPSPAFLLPTRWVPRADVALFAERGIVDLTDDGRYTMHGLDSVRAERSKRASDAAHARWDAERNANGNASRNADASAASMPRRDETRKDETSNTARDPEWLKAWWATGRTYMPSEKQQALIDSYLRTFDVTGDERLAGVFLRGSGDPIAALKADLAAFRAERIAAAKAEETPKPAPRRPARGLTGINAELAAMLREQDAKRGDAA